MNEAEFFVTLTMDVDHTLGMRECFPDGWDGAEPPTAADVVEAMKQDGKEALLRDWNLYHSGDVQVRVQSATVRSDIAKWEAEP